MERVRSIVDVAAGVFGRTPEELLGRSRRQPIVEARQAAMWAVRQCYPSIALIDIGETVGGRHYTTVMHALAAVELRAAHDAAYADRLQRLVRCIRPDQARLERPVPATGSPTVAC